MIMPMCTALAMMAAPTTNVSPAKIRGICSAQPLSVCHAVHALCHSVICELGEKLVSIQVCVPGKCR